MKLTITFVTLAACHACVGPVLAQTTSVADTRLLQPLVAQRAEVDVVQTAGPLVHGRLVEAASSVVVQTARERVQLPIASVRAIWRPARMHVWRDALIGAGVGAGLGGLAIAGQGDCRDPNSICAQDGPVTGADVAIVMALGAGAGAAIARWRQTPPHLAFAAEAPLSAAPAGAPTAAEDEAWNQVADQIGNTIEVQHLPASGTRKGVLVAHTASSMSLIVDGEPCVVQRSDVRRVWKPRRAWWKVPLIGLAAGVGFAAFDAGALGTMACGDSAGCAGAVMAASIGAMTTIVTVTTVRHNREALVYDASMPANPGASRKPPPSITVVPTLGRTRSGVMCAVRF